MAWSFARHLSTKPLLGAEVDLGHPLADGLVAATLFNEANGVSNTPLVDTSPYRHSVAQGTAAWVGGAYGPALRGTATSFATITNAPPLHFAGRMSAMAWVRIADNVGFRQIAEKNANSGFRFRVDQTTNVISYLRIANTITSSVGLVAGQWASVAITESIDIGATGRHLYIDGVLRASGGGQSSGAITNDNIRIGWSAFSENFRGDISHVYFWNRRLTQAEVEWLQAEPFAFYLQPTTRRWFLPLASGLSGTAAMTLAATGSLTVGAARLAGAASLALNASGDLTADLSLSGAATMTLTASGRLRAARFGHALPTCGHPLIGDCDDWFKNDD